MKSSITKTFRKALAQLPDTVREQVVKAYRGFQEGKDKIK